MDQITVILIAQIVVVGVTGALPAFVKWVELNREWKLRRRDLEYSQKREAILRYMDSATSCAYGQCNMDRTYIKNRSALFLCVSKNAIGVVEKMDALLREEQYELAQEFLVSLGAHLAKEISSK